MSWEGMKPAGDFVEELSSQADQGGVGNQHEDG
jgi:hypothetical protein